MNKNILVKGGNKLKGSVKISGAKNSTVALIPALALSEKPVILDDVPEISDVYILAELLESIGAKVIFTKEGDVQKLNIDASKIFTQELIGDNVRKLRASYYLMGSLLGRFNYAKIGIPGGCDLGPRPIDLHIKGFKALGAEVKFEGKDQDVVILDARKNGLKGTRIFLDFASVGATINIMLAAIHAQGTTIIENAAKEPEIIDVATYLNNIGAKIKGVGTSEITIEGVQEIGGGYHQIIPDRIESGTYMIAAALLGEEVSINNIIPEHLESLISKLKEMGVNMEVKIDSVVIKESKNLKPVNITADTYPAFPTDLQQIMATLFTQCEGESQIIDHIYPERFKNIIELQKMGAIANIQDGHSIITGKTKLKSATVKATDLRAGACLVLAGLIAEGETEITNTIHIHRGYEKIISKLQSLGANINVKED